MKGKGIGKKSNKEYSKGQNITKEKNNTERDKTVEKYLVDITNNTGQIVEMKNSTEVFQTIEEYLEENEINNTEQGYKTESAKLTDMDISLLPIVFSEDMDIEKEILVETDGEHIIKPDLIKETKKKEATSKITIISDITLPLPLPKKYKKSVPVSKSRRNSSSQKNYYNNKEDIIKILEEKEG